MQALTAKTCSGSVARSFKIIVMSKSTELGVETVARPHKWVTESKNLVVHAQLNTAIDAQHHVSEGRQRNKGLWSARG